jgi:CheY-like chemotaxis protein
VLLRDRPAGRIEDDPDQAAILEALLRAEGLEVFVAPSGEHALDMHQHAPVDVLVTDLVLPVGTPARLLAHRAPSSGSWRTTGRATCASCAT